MPKIMNILITGATGFIGRHLAYRLAKENYSVRCLVRRSSDISCLSNLNVDIFFGDLLSKDSLGKAMEKIDLIYHLAGEVYSRKKDDYYKGNILATHNLLETCKEKDTKRIIFLSSVGVYKPVTTKILFTEESECEPITFYGKTKLNAEELIKKYNIPWVIVRAPVIYGPHQPTVLNRFFLDAFNKRKIYIFGNGNNLRSLCFIANLVEGLVLLANKADVDGKTYILSDNSPYTFNEIIKVGSKVVQQSVNVTHLPNFLGDISWKICRLMDNVFSLCFVELYAIKKMQLQEGCDITKARNEIGYNPIVTLEAGIKSTISWLRDNYIKE
jgi:nucleoside-diphosphate-sugar epimerase